MFGKKSTDRGRGNMSFRGVGVGRRTGFVDLNFRVDEVTLKM
jgi:hypothetical protein